MKAFSLALVWLKLHSYALKIVNQGCKKQISETLLYLHLKPIVIRFYTNRCHTRKGFAGGESKQNQEM